MQRILYIIPQLLCARRLRASPPLSGEGAGRAAEKKTRAHENLTAKTAKTPSSSPVFPGNAENLAAKTAKTPDGPRPAPPKRASADLSAFAKRKLEQASEMGLVAIWSRHLGYVSIHDPTTGEWHDLHTKDAPGWALREARRRKGGKAYPPTVREVEERRAPERSESHPAVTDKGIVLEDYVEEP